MGDAHPPPISQTLKGPQVRGDQYLCRCQRLAHYINTTGLDSLVLAISTTGLDSLILAISTNGLDSLVLAISTTGLDSLVLAISTTGLDSLILAISTNGLDSLVLAISTTGLDSLVLAISTTGLDSLVLTISRVELRDIYLCFFAELQEVEFDLTRNVSTINNTSYDEKMDTIKLPDLFIRMFLIRMVVQSSGLKDNNVVLQCPIKRERCQDINSDKDRVLTLLDDGLLVMCDTKTDGGGWIIFQRRINGNVSFYRGWEEYKYGFGDFDVGEFYLGNEFIHQLTSKRHYEMRVDLRYNNKYYFASYSHFKILGEPEKYELQVSGYSGNATDNLISGHSHNNQKFSTFDIDNDNYISQCAQEYLGGWWYNKCHRSNLNGQWGNKTYGVGMKCYDIGEFYLGNEKNLPADVAESLRDQNRPSLQKR
ncbi:Ficolin-1 [Bulinus truncatus]|nr:Ficolin-1 [Bulinus truncatus]